MKVGDIYRTYDQHTNTLHWRISGEASMSMLCKRGNFMDWDIGHWDYEGPVGVCQECEVLYVLEMMECGS